MSIYKYPNFELANQKTLSCHMYDIIHTTMCMTLFIQQCVWCYTYKHMYAKC